MSLSESIFDHWLLKYSHERLVFTVGSYVVPSATFWLANLFFLLVDRSGRFAKYKIQPGKYPPLPLVKHCLAMALVGLLLVKPVFAYLMYPLFTWAGVNRHRPVPSIPVILAQFLFFIVVNDTGFYWAHWLLHRSFVYKYIHKRHHEFKVTIGIAAEYAHPVEQLFANITPTLLGPLLLGSHLYVLWFWLWFRLLETVDAHSGYQLPFSPFAWLDRFVNGAQRHDFHHSHNMGNFGSVFVFWDWLMGTDRPFHEWRAKQEKLQHTPQPRAAAEHHANGYGTGNGKED